MYVRVRLRKTVVLYREKEKERERTDLRSGASQRLKIIAVRKAKGMKEKGGNAPQETSTLNIAGGGRDAV